MNQIFDKVLERIRAYDAPGATQAYLALILGDNEYPQEKVKLVTQEARTTIDKLIVEQKIRNNTRKDILDETISYQADRQGSSG